MANVLLVLSTILVAVEGVHKKYSPVMLPATPSPCDLTIPGFWTGISQNHPLGDTYQMAWTVPASPGAWTVHMVDGGGWNVGVGQLSADNTTSTVSFDSGVKLNGNVSKDCSAIYWDNDSSWVVKPPPPPPITDVHIIAMNHLDVGYNGMFHVLSPFSLPCAAQPLPLNFLRLPLKPHPQASLGVA